MRWFWLLVLLMVAGAAWLLWRDLRSPGPATAWTAEVFEAPGALTASDAVAESTATVGGPTAPAARTAPEPATSEPTTLAAGPAMVTPGSAAPDALPTSTPGATGQAEPAPRAAGPPGIDSAPGVGAAPAASAGESASVPRPDVEPGSGRSVRLDDRFNVHGSGTEQDPLRISWDLLLSARETFDPKPALGAEESSSRQELPPRITLLSGQIVSITGYLAPGKAEEESTSELLVMLNRWDGCCLGLPPTPFDVIEVDLAEPVTLRGKHQIRYGTVTGRFEASPFVVAGWLVGLYRLTDATLKWGG